MHTSPPSLGQGWLGTRRLIDKLGREDKVRRNDLRGGATVRILIISRKAEEQRRQFQSRQIQRLGLELKFLDAKTAKAANTWPSRTLPEDIACFDPAQARQENHCRAQRTCPGLATCGPHRIPAISLIRRAIPHRATLQPGVWHGCELFHY